MRPLYLEASEPSIYPPLRLRHLRHRPPPPLLLLLLHRRRCRPEALSIGRSRPQAIAYSIMNQVSRSLRNKKGWRMCVETYDR